jgi:hypothetical protein
MENYLIAIEMDLPPHRGKHPAIRIDKHPAIRIDKELSDIYGEGPSTSQRYTLPRLSYAQV